MFFSNFEAWECDYRSGRVQALGLKWPRKVAAVSIPDPSGIKLVNSEH